MSASQSPDGPRISRRALLQGAGALGLSAASSTWLSPAQALAATAGNPHSAAQPRLASAGHLAADYLPSQPTGWGPVTIGGHVASVPFTFQGTAYEISLLAFGQPGTALDPIYEPEPSDPTIDFKRTLQKEWGANYTFRYRGGLSGRSKITVQSYSVRAIEPTATRPQLSYGGDLFILYEPDPASTDPPITADLQWIQVTHSLGRTFVDGDDTGRANPYMFPGGLTSVYGKPACSFYDVPSGGIGAPPAGKGPPPGKGPTLSGLRMFETFLVLDTGRKDHTGKGILDIYGGIKWGWQVQAAPP
jgi:hypothetical protein